MSSKCSSAERQCGKTAIAV